MSKKSKPIKFYYEDDDKELWDDIERYKTLRGFDKPTPAIKHILREFLKDKLLTKDFIPLDKPLYLIDTREDSSAIFTSINSVSGLDEERWEDVYQLNKVPNNLDEYSEEFDKYCYKDMDGEYHEFIHRGLCLDWTVFKSYQVPFNVEPMLFKYDEESNEVKIKSITKEDIGFEIDLLTHKEVYDKLQSKYEKYNRYDDLLSMTYEGVDSTIVSEELLSFFDVLEPYADNIRVKNHLINHDEYNDDNDGSVRSILENSKKVKAGDISAGEYLYDLLYSDKFIKEEDDEEDEYLREVYNEIDKN